MKRYIHVLLALLSTALVLLPVGAITLTAGVLLTSHEAIKHALDHLLNTHLYSMSANEVIPVDIIKNGASLFVANEFDLNNAARGNLDILLQQNPNLAKSTSEYLVEFYQRKAETLENVWATIKASPLANGIKAIKPEMITVSAGNQLRALSTATSELLGSWGKLGGQFIRDLDSATSSLPTGLPDVNGVIASLPDVNGVIASNIPDVTAVGKDVLESSVNLVGSAADAGKVFLESSVSSVGSTASEILTRTTTEVGTQISAQASALTSTIQTSIEDAGTKLPGATNEFVDVWVKLGGRFSRDLNAARESFNPEAFKLDLSTPVQNFFSNVKVGNPVASSIQSSFKAPKLPLEQFPIAVDEFVSALNRFGVNFAKSFDGLDVIAKRNIEQIPAIAESLTLKLGDVGNDLGKPFEGLKGDLDILIQQNPNLSKSTSEYLVEFYQSKAETFQRFWSVVKTSPLANGIKEISFQQIK